MNFKLVPTLAFMCLLPALLALGFWQLGRATEKQAFLDLEAQRLAAERLQLSVDTEDNAERLRYLKAKVSGRYDISHQLLIDNQIQAGKAGYFVLTPFLVAGSNKAVLVNRGWLPLTGKRTQLPAIDFAGTQTVLSGRINTFPSVGIKLAGAEIPSKYWPSLVQVVDTQVLAKVIGYPLFSFQLELDKDQADGYQREWRSTTIMLPEQHIAYALQWFGLALTLTIIFIWFSFKKNNNDTTT